MKLKLIHIFSLLVMFVFSLQLAAQETYYVCDDATERSWGTIGNSGEYSLSGPGVTITYEAKRSTLGGGYFFVQYYDESKWVDISNPDLSTSYQAFSCTIPSIDVKKVRFATKTGATLSKYVKNVRVTRATTLTSSTKELDFGTINRTADPSGTVTRNITIDYNNTYSGAVLSATCPEGFSVSTDGIGDFGATGSKTISITYDPISAGIHGGDITLTMGTPAKGNNVTYTFQVTGTCIATLTLDPENPAVVPAIYDHVTLNRTIPAGLSTIALPFDTTVEAITGDSSDKAYTLCNVGYRQGEGYTFYFKEVEGGVLQAGKPYVISSASEVVNPQWGETTIGELAAGEVVCGAWSFKANFEAGKSMEGLYGVVNSQNKVMKGGAGSTLNAFSAYFELVPAAASTAVSTKANSAEDIPADAFRFSPSR